MISTEARLVNIRYIYADVAHKSVLPVRRGSITSNLRDVLQADRSFVHIAMAIKMVFVS